MLGIEKASCRTNSELNPYVTLQCMIGNWPREWGEYRHHSTNPPLPDPCCMHSAYDYFTYQWYNRHSHIRKLNTACVESADKHLHKDKILTLITIHNIHWGCSQYRLSKMSKSLKKYLIYVLIYTPADIHQHPHVHCHCVSWSPPSLEQLQPEENIITYKLKMSCVQPVL